MKNKSKMYHDKNAIAPVIAAAILIIGCAIAGGVLIAAYQLTQKPDIIYNITETGFALAGIDASALYLIAGVITVLGILWFISRKPKNA